MPIAFKRSIRQLVSAIIAIVCAVFVFSLSNSSGIFLDPQGQPIFQGSHVWGPYAAAIGAFFVGFYVATMLLKSKAAR